MYALAPSDPRTLKRVAGEAWFQPQGEAAWLPLGDVVLHRLTVELQRKPTLRARRFGLALSDEHVYAASVSYRIELQEYLQENIAALFLAATEDDWEQPALSAQTVAFASLLRRRMYDLGAVAIANVVVKIGTEVFAEGRDYVVDAIGGTIWLPASSGLREGETMTVTFDAAPTRMNRVTGLGARSELRRTGTLRLVEHDGDHDAYTGAPLRSILTFPCALSIDEGDESAVGAFSSHKLRAAITGPIDVRTRTTPEPRVVGPDELLTWGTPLRLLGQLRIEAGGTVRIR